LCAAEIAQGISYSGRPSLKAIFVMNTAQNWRCDDTVVILNPMTVRRRRNRTAIGNDRS
jgi:hypothetical protein